MLTPEEAAELISVHPETIRRMIRDGRLPASKPGGRYWRIDPADLAALTASTHAPDHIRQDFLDWIEDGQEGPPPHVAVLRGCQDTLPGWAVEAMGLLPGAPYGMAIDAIQAQAEPAATIQPHFEIDAVTSTADTAIATWRAWQDKPTAATAARHATAMERLAADLERLKAATRYDERTTTPK